MPRAEGGEPAIQCAHLGAIAEVEPSSTGCEECLAIGGWWVHLRMCMSCGNVGCCDSSPNRHASAHWRQVPDHPVVRSYEPGEDWWWCFPEQLRFYVPGAPPAPSHP
jgi:Zn-finger in ubiquitin-hydrolases and other protein